MRRWSKAIIISDQGGDLNPMRKMQFEFPGRVFLAFYRKPKKSTDVFEWGEGDNHGVVVIDRNSMIQSMIEQMKEGGRIRLNGTRPEWQEFADHFANMYREKITVREQKDKDNRSLYGAEYVWKRRGPDHWAHCLVYAMVGMDKYGTALATVTGSNPLDAIQRGQIVSDEGVVLRGNIAF